MTVDLKISLKILNIYNNNINNKFKKLSIKIHSKSFTKFNNRL